MVENDYEGVIPEWVAQLIRERATRLGVRREDLADAQQDIVMKILGFDYQQSKSNGASLRTVLTSLIDRQLKARLRAGRRYQDRLGRIKEAGQTDDRVYSTHRDHLAVDVRAALAELSPRERGLCRALALGCTLTEIAARWGCGWHTLDRRLKRIREQFAKLGLDGWLDR